MQAVVSFEDLQQQVGGIRSLQLGFVTNYYPDADKHSLWIQKRDCYAERVGKTLFVIKKSPTFWNVFYCSTTKEELGDDLSLFLLKYNDRTMVFDIVGKKEQCLPLVGLFQEKGLTNSTSLVRMIRITAPVDYTSDSAIKQATVADIPKISRLLHVYFDEQTKQIPYDEELMEYRSHGHVLVCEENGLIVGFLIFEKNASTLYLRYWFTHPKFRNRKVGSKLLRRFFEEGRETRRQLFWVMRNNENAIVRYRHYGFVEENMYDYVMQYNDKKTTREI